MVAVLARTAFSCDVENKVTCDCGWRLFVNHIESVPLTILTSINRRGVILDKVLIVDDDVRLLAGLRRQLHRQFHVVTAEGGAAALDTNKEQGPFTVIVGDMRMPGMDGVQTLEAFKKQSPDTTRIMLTGNADQQTAIDAINKGNIFSFYTKPCTAEELAKGVDAGIRQHRLVTAERELLEKTLAGSVKRKTIETRRLLHRKSAA